MVALTPVKIQHVIFGQEIAEPSVQTRNTNVRDDDTRTVTS